MQSSNGVAGTGDSVIYGNPGDCSALQLGKALFCFSRPGVLNVRVRSQALETERPLAGRRWWLFVRTSGYAATRSSERRNSGAKSAPFGHTTVRSSGWKATFRK